MPVQTRQKRQSKRLMAKSSKVTSANLKTSQAKSGKRPTRQRVVNKNRARNSTHVTNSERIITGVDQQNIGRGNTQVAEQMLQRIFEDDRLTPEARQLIYLWKYFNFKNKEQRRLAYLGPSEEDTGELLLLFARIYGKTILEHGLYSQFLFHTEMLFRFGHLDYKVCIHAVMAIQQQARRMNMPLQLHL